MIQQFILPTADGKFLPIIYFDRYGKKNLQGAVCSNEVKAQNTIKRMSADTLYFLLLHYVNHREKALSIGKYISVSKQASINKLRDILKGKESLEKTVTYFFENRYHIRNIMPSPESRFFLHQSEFCENLISYCFTELQKIKK